LLIYSGKKTGFDQHNTYIYLLVDAVPVPGLIWDAAAMVVAVPFVRGK
jgi:hypothetical protein